MVTIVKKSSVMIFCIGLCAASFAGTFSGYVSGTRASSDKPRPLPPSSDAAAEEEMSDIYVVAENNGELALYRKTSGGNRVLWEKYDSEVSMLPEVDRAELKRGIEAYSLDEAMQIIEDFSS